MRALQTDNYVWVFGFFFAAQGFELRASHLLGSAIPLEPLHQPNELGLYFKGQLEVDKEGLQE
jgi:hypothetical protein